jgi:hypothetical protein
LKAAAEDLDVLLSQVNFTSEPGAVSGNPVTQSITAIVAPDPATVYEQLNADDRVDRIEFAVDGIEPSGASIPADVENLVTVHKDTDTGAWTFRGIDRNLTSFSGAKQKIKVTITDKFGGSATATLQITINN